MEKFQRAPIAQRAAIIVGLIVFILFVHHFAKTDSSDASPFNEQQEAPIVPHASTTSSTSSVRGHVYPADRRAAGFNPVTGTAYVPCEWEDKDLHHPSLLKFGCFGGMIPDGASLVHPNGVLVPQVMHYWPEGRRPKGFIIPEMLEMWRKDGIPPFRKSYYHAPVFQSPSYFGEEYVQLIASAEAVLAAKDSFVGIELGAGFGRWILTAFHFNMQKQALPTLLIAVEGDVLHQKFLNSAMSYNSLQLHEYNLFEGVVSDHDGESYFCGSGSATWLGQSIVKTPDNCKTGMDDVIGTTIRVRSYSLRSILEPHHRVDYLDMDVQYAELPVVKDAKEMIDQKVARIVIEVHDLEQMPEFVELFTEMKWNIHYVLRPSTYHSKVHTKHGDLFCQGGMFYASNPKL